MNIGGLSRDSRVTTELSTSSLRQAIYILTPEYIQTIIDTEYITTQNDTKPCYFECKGTEGSKQVCMLAWWTLKPLPGCHHGVMTVGCWRTTWWSFQHSVATIVLRSLLDRCNLNTIVNLVFVDDGGWLVVADIAVKWFEFWVVMVYALRITGESHSLFQQFVLFFDNPKWLVLVGDWNAILDLKVDRVRC